jgi:hypothetical protein
MASTLGNAGAGKQLSRGGAVNQVKRIGLGEGGPVSRYRYADLPTVNRVEAAATRMGGD